tara:strand:+ start:273 stop:689 length:417 start_codon:yes stop_codon:yes gene_type:complete
MNIIIKKIDENNIKIQNMVYIKKEYKIYYEYNNIKILGLPIKIKYNYIHKYNKLYYIYFLIKDNQNLFIINNYLKKKIPKLQFIRNSIKNNYIICNNYNNLHINNVNNINNINDNNLYITINKIKNIKNNNIPIINIL